MTLFKAIKAPELTLNVFLAQLEEENSYIRRIRLDEHSIVIETGYNVSGGAMKNDKSKS